MEQTITIKKIAITLGITPATVSMALNNHPAIADETKRRFQITAKKLNHKPNSITLSIEAFIGAKGGRYFGIMNHSADTLHHLYLQSANKHQ